jgi:hypothetical protein
VLCPIKRLLTLTARKNEITIRRAPIPILPIASKTGLPVTTERMTAIRANVSPISAALSSPRTTISSL